MIPRIFRQAKAGLMDSRTGLVELTHRTELTGESAGAGREAAQEFVKVFPK
jgi:hypothetical protein